MPKTTRPSRKARPTKAKPRRRATSAKAARTKATTGQPQLEKVGIVEGFFVKPSAAVIKLKGKLMQGERIYIKGHTTDLKTDVESMQIDRQAIAEAKKGQIIGLQVPARVRPNDIVYRLS